MKSFKVLFLGTLVLWAVLACGVASQTPPAAATLPTRTPSSPAAMPSQPRAFTQTPTFAPIVAEAPDSLRGVAEFSDPILAALEGQKPAIEDDFPNICIDERKKWKVCSTPEQRIYYQADEYDESSLSSLPLATARPTLDFQPDLQEGYALLNKGWFYVTAEDPQKLYYAPIDMGALPLRLPAGAEKRDFWVYNPNFLQRNFVIEFDLQFGESQPDDAFRFQFQEKDGSGFALELAKNQDWDFEWGAADSRQSNAGIYHYFASQPLRVLVIASGSRCAVYLDNVPLEYVEACRPATDEKISRQAMTFHILSQSARAASLTLDNFRLWNLDEISVPSPPAE